MFNAEKLQKQVDLAVEGGQRESAVGFMGELLRKSGAIQPVEFPVRKPVWEASRAMTYRDGDKPSRLGRLHALHRDFGGPNAAEVVTARQAVDQMGKYRLEDDDYNGFASWRTPDGDLHAVNLDTQHPYRPETAAILTALEEAGYQQVGADDLPSPFSGTNPHHNVAAWQTQQ